MNPITGGELPPPPPQPPQPHRNSTSCDRHPEEQFSGFCPSCLCERLAVLDKSPATNASTGRKLAIKSLFKPSNNDGGRGKASSSSFLPELRRTQSFSGGKNDGGFLGFSGALEPQRKSCDVRGRSTLFSLFTRDDEKFKGQDQDEDEIQEEIQVEPIINTLSSEQQQQPPPPPPPPPVSGVQKVDLKPMKYHIDLDSQNKRVSSRDFKELAGSFWSAASVFSKKLRAWTRKNNHHHHKMKKNGSHTVQVSVKKNNAGRNYRDTQSEIADYGFGRRSCDTDPRFSVDAAMAGRFSVDAGRLSFDDGRCSFDEPRASWDGCLTGRTFPRMMPPMVSLVEDAPVTVSRIDSQIPVEEPRRSSVSINGNEPIPGGAAQTKDYYSDSSSRRRRSLDRSSSVRRTAAAVVAEMDEMNSARVHVHPPCADYLNGTRDFRELDFHSNSLRDNTYSESFDLELRDNVSVIGSNCERKGSKKSRGWRAWNIWGLIYRRGTSKDDYDDQEAMSNGVERSYSESWHVDPRGNRNVLRSHSWRNSSYGSIRKGAIDANDGGRKKNNEMVFERNSNCGADNGMLRFYLTPMRGSRRASSGKPKPTYSHSFARSVLRLY